MSYLKRTISVLLVATLVGLLALVAGCTEPPVASVTADKNIAAVGEAIQLTSTSTGEITLWSWDFGDGTTSTEQNPSHAYAEEAHYTVSLTVSNKAGSNTATLAITVLVPPVASFTADETKITVGEAIQFTNKSTGKINSWSWDFGDGTTSSEQNPSYAYTEEGHYTVSLTASNEVGSDTATLAITVLVPPVASFATDKKIAAVDEAIHFTDESAGEIVSWSWDFGDGTTNTEQNPAHAYTKKGNYSVSLEVSNKAGGDTATLAITVLEPPLANFSASETKAVVDLKIQFTDESSGDIDSWSWDFGDGTTSTAWNPSHTYKDAGTYTVSLTVSNAVSKDTRVKRDYITITSFVISQFVFCSDITEQGECTPRVNDIFHVGEEAWIYFKVTGFEQWKTDGEYEIWVQWQQLKFYGPDGNLITALNDIAELHETTATMVPYLYFWLSLGEVEKTDPLGVYTVEVKVEDKLSGETAIRSRGFLLE